MVISLFYFLPIICSEMNGTQILWIKSEEKSTKRSGKSFLSLKWEQQEGMVYLFLCKSRHQTLLYPFSSLPEDNINIKENRDIKRSGDIVESLTATSGAPSRQWTLYDIIRYQIHLGIYALSTIPPEQNLCELGILFVHSCVSKA